MLDSSAYALEFIFISDTSFEDAVTEGLKQDQLEGYTGAWVKEQRIISRDDTTLYQVNVLVTWRLGDVKRGLHI